MLVNEKKIYDVIGAHHIEIADGGFKVSVCDKVIVIRTDSFRIYNDAMLLCNQQHDGHIYSYCKDQYVKQELKDFL